MLRRINDHLWTSLEDWSNLQHRAEQHICHQPDWAERTGEDWVKGIYWLKWPSSAWWTLYWAKMVGVFSQFWAEKTPWWWYGNLRMKLSSICFQSSLKGSNFVVSHWVIISSMALHLSAAHFWRKQKKKLASCILILILSIASLTYGYRLPFFSTDHKERVNREMDGCKSKQD